MSIDNRRQILWGQEAKAPKAWRDWLEAGDIDRLLHQAGKHLPASGQGKKSMLKQLCYFEKNAPQMRYAEYRQKNFFVGSGVVEAGCRTVIGERLKQSGMRWSVRGANAIIALRCCILSGRFEDFGPAAPRSSHFYLVHPHGVSRRLALTLGRWFAAYPEANAAHWRAFHTRARLTMDSLRQLGPQIVKAASNVRSFLFPAESRCEPADSCPCVRGRSGLSSSHRWSTCRKIRSR